LITAQTGASRGFQHFRPPFIRTLVVGPIELQELPKRESHRRAPEIDGVMLPGSLYGRGAIPDTSV
jgi:hypothetical protein